MIYDFSEGTKLFFIIYLSFYSRKGPLFIVSLRDRWRDIYSDIYFFLSHTFFWEPGGFQRLHLLASRDASDRLRVPRSTPILCTLSKSDRVVITWSPPGYTPILPNYPDTLSQRDSLWKHTASLGTNRKSMSYVIKQYVSQVIHVMKLHIT